MKYMEKNSNYTKCTTQFNQYWENSTYYKYVDITVKGDKDSLIKLVNHVLNSIGSSITLTEDWDSETTNQIRDTINCAGVKIDNLSDTVRPNQTSDFEKNIHNNGHVLVELGEIFFSRIGELSTGQCYVSLSLTFDNMENDDTLSNLEKFSKLIMSFPNTEWIVDRWEDKSLYINDIYSDTENVIDELDPDDEYEDVYDYLKTLQNEIVEEFYEESHLDPYWIFDNSIHGFGYLRQFYVDTFIIKSLNGTVEVEYFTKDQLDQLKDGDFLPNHFNKILLFDTCSNLYSEVEDHEWELGELSKELRLSYTGCEKQELLKKVSDCISTLGELVPKLDKLKTFLHDEMGNTTSSLIKNEFEQYSLRV